LEFYDPHRVKSVSVGGVNLALAGDVTAPVLCSGDGDGVVPVSSAWQLGVASEQFVNATHTKLHHQPQTINGLLQILAVHVAQYDAETAAIRSVPPPTCP
jgi:hypothetical protein